MLSLHSSAAHTIIQMFYIQHKQKEVSGAALWGLIRQFNPTKAVGVLQETDSLPHFSSFVRHKRVHVVGLFILLQQSKSVVIAHLNS